MPPRQPASKMSRAQLEAENSLLKRFHVSGNIATIISNLSRYGSLVAISYMIYLTVGSLAGKVTMTDIKIAGTLDVSDALGAIFRGSGLLYGIAQKRLRSKTIKRLKGRIQELEQQRDPNRTSSGLTPEGETRPEDRT